MRRPDGRGGQPEAGFRTLVPGSGADGNPAETGQDASTASTPGLPGQPAQPGQPAPSQHGPAAVASTRGAAGPPAPAGQGGRSRSALARPVAAQLTVLAAYLVAGIAVSWPLASYPLRGRLPGSRDVASYVWGFWWVARQVSQLSNPWVTTHMAAPVGMQLGFDTLLPLPGLLLTPVTLLFGPSATFGLLAVVTPGLLCYVAYRAARLWLGQCGAIAAGAFFGLSTMATWQDWFHLNIAIGTLFLPMTLEGAIRLRRSPSWRRGVGCGLVLGAAVLTNQESAVVAALLAVALLVPWLLLGAARGRSAAAIRPGLLAVLAAAVVAAVVASPQLIAMAQQAAAGGASAGGNALARTYLLYGAGIPTLVAPSPRLDLYHLGVLASGYAYRQPLEGVATFGVVLSAMAVLGLAVTRRRRSSWWLALMWMAGAALALGPTLQVGSRQYVPLAARWHGVVISRLLPYSWLVRVPGLSALREADRLALLGLLGAAVLAGAGVEWLSRSALRPGGRRGPAAAMLAVVLIAGLAEAGWSGSGSHSIPTATTRLDAPIAADHSGSIVLDLPFGLRGGIPLVGSRIAMQPLVMATADGHPRAVSYSSWVPRPTITRMEQHPFYDCLIAVQDGRSCAAARLAAAAADAGALNIGWVVDWYSGARVLRYLRETGFRPDYSVGGVAVWRPASR